MKAAVNDTAKGHSLAAANGFADGFSAQFATDRTEYFPEQHETKGWLPFVDSYRTFLTSMDAHSREIVAIAALSK